MDIAISTPIRNAMLDALTGRFDGGTGRVNIYTGAKPANASAAATGTLLATLTLAADAAADAVNGQAAFNAITADSEADASGAPGWYRVYNTGEAAPGSVGTSADSRLDGDCGAVGSGASMQFDDLSIEEGGEVRIASMVVTMPAETA